MLWKDEDVLMFTEAGKTLWWMVKMTDLAVSIWIFWTRMKTLRTLRSRRGACSFETDWSKTPGTVLPQKLGKWHHDCERQRSDNLCNDKSLDTTSCNHTQQMLAVYVCMRLKNNPCPGKWGCTCRHKVVCRRIGRLLVPHVAGGQGVKLGGSQRKKRYRLFFKLLPHRKIGALATSRILDVVKSLSKEMLSFEGHADQHFLHKGSTVQKFTQSALHLCADIRHIWERRLSANFYS